IIITQGEANQALRTLFTSAPWHASASASRQRAVVFLDPYGLSVDWSTLELLARTGRVDVWYLFPRKAVVQQLAHKIHGVDADKRRRLAHMFGGNDWEDEFYKAGPVQAGLFDASTTPGKDRIATPEEIC